MKVPRLDHLSPEDAEILALESGPIAGHTLKVAVAQRPEGSRDLLAELRTRVAAGVALERRCRQRLVPTPLGLAPPAWVDDPDFDLSLHVRAQALESGPDALSGVVAHAMAERLDRERPLWSVTLVEGLERDRVAYVMKIHHCMADGTGALRLASALLWNDPPEAPGPMTAGRPAPGPGVLVASGLRERLGAAGATARSLARAADTPSRWRSGASSAAAVPGAIARELRAVAGPSPLDAPIGRSRSVAFVSRPLDDLKRAAHLAEGAKVNDAILAAVAGGLRGWLVRRGESLPAMRVKVPVSMHDAEEGPAALGNRDSFFFVDLPLSESDPLRRLEIVARETTECKRHHDAETLYTLFNDLSHVSRRALRRANAIAGRPGVFSLCVSNVPGPRERMHALGAPVEELHSLAEIGDRHGLRVSALSHAGQVSIGLCADAGGVAQLDVLAEALEESVGELCALS